MTPGKPYFHTREAMDLFENGLKRDEAVGRRAIALLQEHRKRPFFLFVHFAEVDSSGHKYGENSPEYRRALISNDYWTGRILTTLKELGLAKRTLVYVTADHGFDENLKGHRAAPHVFLVTNDQRVCRGGLRQDVAATIYDGLGLDPKAFDPPLDGTSLAKQLKQPRQKRARKKAGP
ncbi:MAG: alkaline phosphatase family protein [Planctomycetota bacterium]